MKMQKPLYPRSKEVKTMLDRAKYLICLFLVILLSGCMASKKPGIIIEYDRTGGLIGFNDHLTIDNEGNAILMRKNAQTTFKLDAVALKHLETSLNAANFTMLKKSYSPSQPGNDLIQYSITYNGYTVLMKDTAIPASMQPILDSLNQIVDNSSR
jgi:hypothetical protein